MESVHDLQQKIYTTPLIRWSYYSIDFYSTASQEILSRLFAYAPLSGPLEKYEIQKFFEKFYFLMKNFIERPGGYLAYLYSIT